MSLYPTPARLALLRDVDAENVIEGITEEGTYLVDPQPPHDIQKVTARIAEMFRAGWVDMNPACTWQLTAAGRAVLEADGADRESRAAEIAAEHFHLTPGDPKGTR